MFSKNIITFILCLWVTSGFSQNIRGTIKSQRGEVIPNANISILNSVIQTTSDNAGKFSLHLNRGRYQIKVEARGCAGEIKAVIVNSEELTLDIELQDNTRVLEEVVVSGSDKTETDVQKTAAAISVLSAKKLNEYRAWNVADLSALAPSLFVLEHGNSSGSNFFNIRGTMGFTTEQSVATYVDGVYQFDFYSSPINFNNIERIEILRGPQGALYGRNAFSGVVNIITKKPTNSVHGYAEADFGNYGQQRYTLGLNTPILKDRLYFNVSGQYNGRGSIYRNPTLNTDDFDHHRSFNINGNLKYILNDKWQLLVNAKTEKNKDKGAYPWSASYEEAWTNGYNSYSNWDNTEKRTNTNVSATANYFGDKFNFISITSGIAYHIWIPNRFDYDFTSANLISGKTATKSREFTQEFRFSSPAGANKFKWTAGTYLFTEKIKTNTDVYYDEDYAVYDPSAPYRTLTYDERRNWGLAFFGQATYSLTDKLDITAGARYESERRKQDETNDYEKNSVQTPLTDLETNSKTFNAFTPKVTLAYKLTENSLLYASYAKGFRVGGFNMGATASNYRYYKPEKSDNYEVAIKNNLFSNKLKINVTAFYLQQKDQQVSTSNDGVNYLILNAGDMNNLGIEAEIAAVPVDNLSIEWNAAWSDAKYAKLEMYDLTSASVIDYKDNRPINNPNFLSMLATQYNYPLAKNERSISLFARAEYKYVGNYYLDFVNQYYQSAYGIINARAGITAERFEIAAWGRNLNDKRYMSWGYGSYMLGNPRMYGVTSTYRF
ncbi:TonB-dependent receptor [Sphingobacterium sp. LRF_L2]|uniref:TonB-dependent receptor n=1 Tax=Sphingobacterium sp. LRF_L2 TaxID=3369421 RepID=UPI003F5FCA73